jgi:hypothetical protein
MPIEEDKWQFYTHPLRSVIIIRSKCNFPPKKRRESQSDTPTCSPYIIASRSLLRNMQEAFKGTTFLILI